MIELKPFNRSDRDLTRLNAALHLYRRLIPEEARNPEEQIIYWIDNAKSRLTDEFKSLSIHSNDEMIGYFQYSYFVDEHLFFFEYLCLNKCGKKGLIRNDFLKAIQSFFSTNYKPGYSIAFESVRNNVDGEWVPDEKRLKYYEFLGFRRVKFDYRYPVLQSYGEESYPADLLVRLPDGSETVKASDLRMILRAIYFKHYLRWDKPFLGTADFHKRERIINNLYAEEIAVISNQNEFETTGIDRKRSFWTGSGYIPKISIMVKEIFGNHPLLRLSVIIVLFLISRIFLNNDYMFIPFVLTVFAAWCLIDDKETSRKLFIAILNQIGPRRQKQ
jgi:type IV secretory pathway VirB3-like protein